MTAADGARGRTDDATVLDDETADKLRRFLRSIARDDQPHVVARTPRDPEVAASRFAWSCEELNVALDWIASADRHTRRYLLDHGVDATLRAVRDKADALLADLAH
jgi:hypothetical protein